MRLLSLGGLGHQQQVLNPVPFSICLRPVQVRRWRHAVVRVAGSGGEKEEQESPSEAASVKSTKGDARVSAPAAAAGPAVAPSKFGSGAGFGAPAASAAAAAPKAKPKAKKQAASRPGSVPVRRAPPSQPLLGSQGDLQSQQIETAYVVSLGFLGVLILLEGLALAASGLLPEEWDDFIVRVLYPSYTPTVGLFLLGGAAYGLFKYFGIKK